MKFLLSVIAVCLVMITAKLYIPEAQAEVAGMDWLELMYDYDFQEAVKSVVGDNCKINVYERINVYDPQYVESIKLDFSQKVSC